MKPVILLLIIYPLLHEFLKSLWQFLKRKEIISFKEMLKLSDNTLFYDTTSQPQTQEKNRPTNPKNRYKNHVKLPKNFPDKSPISPPFLCNFTTPPQLAPLVYEGGGRAKRGRGESETLSLRTSPQTGVAIPSALAVIARAQPVAIPQILHHPIRRAWACPRRRPKGAFRPPPSYLVGDGFPVNVT